MSDPIPLAIPFLGGNEWRYVKECLDTNTVAAAGTFIGRFERAVADHTGAKHAVAVATGTAALHVALTALGVGPGDLVIAPDFTFAAPVNAILYTGARAVLLDVDRATCALDAGAVAAYLEGDCVREGGRVLDRASRRPVKAIVAVHLYGHPADLDPLHELALRHGLEVVEDAAECLGARYRGRTIGARGRAVCFSFNGNKVITTGGGGMVVSDDQAFAARCRHLANQAKAHPTEYLHDEVGFNYRLPNLNAAIGVAQMERLREHLADKQRIAATYARLLAPFPGVTHLRAEPWAESSSWLNTVLIEPAPGRRPVAEVSAALRGEAIECRRVWPPLHGQAPYRDCPARPAPNAEWLYARGLNLPSSVGLGDAEIARVVARLGDHLSLR